MNRNLETNFNEFLKEFEINQRGYVVSSFFPETEFMHNKDLIDGGKSLELLTKRANRFMENYRDAKNNFIYGMPLKSLNSEIAINNFCMSIVNFITKLNPKQCLYIYLTYENTTGDLNYYNKLKTTFKTNQVMFALFEREISQGPWGIEDNYPLLIKKLKLKGFFYPSLKKISNK